MAEVCRRLALSPRFDAAMLVVIVLNAIVLGAETYDGVARDHGDLLGTLNDVFLGVFVAELAIRMIGLRREWPSSGWNIFDFVVVAASFAPGLRENATLLRLLRLARIVRAVRLLPDLRILIVAIGRSIPGVGSLAAMTLLLVYIYAMVGWVIFDDHDPENFGNVGQAMITMFVLLTLENLPVYIDNGQELSQWTIVFFVSYVLVASFLIFNLFIGIVINSMEEARAIEHRRERESERAAAAVSTDEEDDLTVALSDRMDELRSVLDELEVELKARAKLRAEGRA
jgi:voltage-gated sodium channel